MLIHQNSGNYSSSSFNAQVSIYNIVVKKFAEANGLRLNAQKCLLVLGRRRNCTHPTCEVEGLVQVIHSSAQGKYMGYTWSGDLLATHAIEENIQKVRRSFFHFGSIGAFQGDLNPLSTKSVMETCVVPVILMVVKTGLSLKGCYKN